ncbi:MAG: hypothetical protein KA257_02540 [Opitutaceae bacterium]|nr:hypothetical protein [Opitutaceae bacterium]
MLLIPVGLFFDPTLRAAVKYSDPVGGNIITLRGAVNGVPKVNTFSIAVRLPVGSSLTGKAHGALSGVTATTLSDSSAGWSSGALSQAATPYFVKMRSGAAAGTWWQISTSTANTASTVTVLNRGLSPTAAGISIGDAYELVPGDTLATFFGGIASSIGGVDSAHADAVRLHDGTIWREYYFNTSSGIMQWREGSVPFNRNNIIIRPDSGVVYYRRATGDITLGIVGTVATANERVTVRSALGITVVGSAFPITRTLGSLNIQDMPGFVKNSGTLAAADKVTLFDGTIWKNFNYNISASQWREGTAPFNRNNFVIPYGAPVIIERGTDSTGDPVLLILKNPYSL